MSQPLYKMKALLQDVATFEFGGFGFIDAQDQVEKWLNKCDRVHIISVYGIPYSGKTNLLQLLCNKHRQVSNSFNSVFELPIGL